MKSLPGGTLRIGVTGGMGSGKSTVCSLFRTFGVPVLPADDVAKELMTKDKGLRSSLIRLLGEEAYRTDGSLNRKWIAETMFASPSLQRNINSLVHPKVLQEINRRILSLDGKVPYILIEAALIYEAGFDAMLDGVIVVESEPELQIQRVQKRDGLKKEEILQRMKAQWSAKRKAQKADYIIRNNGTLQELERNVGFLHTLFTRIAQQEPS